MLYNEFIEGTKCKDTEYNYKVYKQLESLYMDNDKLTKEDIYAVSKKLVDNSLTEEETKTLEMAKEEIKTRHNWIEEVKRTNSFIQELIDRDTYYINNCTMTDEEVKTSAENIKYWKKQIANNKKDIQRYKRAIKENQIILKSIR